MTLSKGKRPALLSEEQKKYVLGGGFRDGDGGEKEFQRTF